MGKILSIVVPSYNVEKYLKTCLDSLIIESVLESIEVIVVDDGSKDGTARIAKEYEKKWPETFRLVQKENGGHGSTINTGISLAQGTYFKVLDSDDWVIKDGLEKLVAFLKRTEADVVLSHYSWISHDTKTVIREYNVLLEGMVYEKTYTLKEVADKLYLRMHEMTIKTSILRDNAIFIDEHCFYVDQEYTVYPTCYWNTVAVVDALVYQYRLGLSGQSMSRESMQRNVSQHYHVLCQLLHYYDKAKKAGAEEYRLHYLEKHISYVVGSQIKIYLSFPVGKERKEEIIKLENWLKEEYRAIYEAVENDGVRLMRKSRYLLYPVAVWMLRLIWK